MFLSLENLSKKINKILFYSILTFFTKNCLQAQTFLQKQNIIGLERVQKNNAIAVADYDGDLDLDIFIVAKEADGFKSFTKSKLFKNNSNGTFTDITKTSGLQNLLAKIKNNQESSAFDGFKSGVSWADFNNDGFPDLFLTATGKLQLFKNNGDSTFSDITNVSGIIDNETCVYTGITWFDVNNDGFLDIYVSEWGNCQNSLYINNGNETFSEVSQIFFGNIPSKNSYQATPFDFNNDGWMDLYVSNDLGLANDLFINQEGKSFKQESSKYGLRSTVEDMGVAIGDYNNDGFFDFYIAVIRANVLFKNQGDNTFTDVANEKGVLNTGWAWGPIFADFDLDGDEDLFITNGYKEADPVQQPNTYFKNLKVESGKASFTNVSTELGFTDKATSVTPVAFDYDNDGDLDLIVSSSDKPLLFYENEIINNQNTSNDNWLKVKLQGTTSNRDAIGAIVTIETDTKKLIRHNSSITHLSQSSKPIHFGIGTDEKINKIEIKWPSGVNESYTDLDVNTSFLFVENNNFSEYKIPKVSKREGCLDPFSCNYDPLAVIDNNSCNYLASNSISGNTTSNFLAIETYTYTASNEENALQWEVIGGEIVDGQNTNMVKIKWNVTQNGTVSVRENDNNCSSKLITLPVSLLADENLKNHSVARLWNEALLNAIRNDFARPTVHARNLFHCSIALYDTWAIFNNEATTYLIGKNLNDFQSNYPEFSSKKEKNQAINEAMSFAAYRLLTHRFKNSPNQEKTQELFDFLMEKLGYDVNETSTDYSTGNSTALGNYIAKTLIDYGLQDGARETLKYTNAYYQPVNLSLAPVKPGNERITDPNRWQPLSFNEFIDQSGNLIQTSVPGFLSPEWGNVLPFSLTEDDKENFSRDGNSYNVFLNPGAPPYINTTTEDDMSPAYKWGFSMVSSWASHLDPSDSVLWDISPKSNGNVNLDDTPTSFNNFESFYNYLDGGDIGKGHDINPITKEPYQEQIVPRGDYTRVLAEFWADGPDSETPPGHWFTILNHINDHPLLIKKLKGGGETLNALEWDVKSYFLLGGAMHDAAIAAWSVKGWYDYIRPISAIRYMADLGQSTDPTKSNYNIAGIPLVNGKIEIVEDGDALQGDDKENIGKIKLYTWRGPDFIENPKEDIAGVDWILAENWWPYQRPTFITPPFAGYVSGHSTFSRAAAEVLTQLTGDAYFPGGVGEFIAKKDEFLVFEKGPSVDIKLQWATYRDASDQSSLSRIWGGIHPPADDLPGRRIGKKVGINAFELGTKYFDKSILNVDDQILKRNFTLSPNPTTGLLTVSEDVNTITVYSITGRLVKTFKKVNSKIDVSNLQSGVYIIKTNTGYQRKIVKY